MNLGLEMQCLGTEIEWQITCVQIVKEEIHCCSFIFPTVYYVRLDLEQGCMIKLKKK